jgi:hypothetical protein
VKKKAQINTNRVGTKGLSISVIVTPFKVVVENDK